MSVENFGNNMQVNADMTAQAVSSLKANNAADAMPASSAVSSESKTQMLSAKGRVWRLPPDSQIDQKIIDVAGSLSLAKILVRRGIRTQEAIQVFMDPSLFVPSNAMAFPDMPKAVARISKAVSSGENITVYGDYDVDGVTGTSVLVTALKKVGAKVDFYIPNRLDEGYGLNLKAVSVLASKRRTKLIITCDCGISNFSEINLAKSLGVDTIVVDHHSIPEMFPPAHATIHPKLLPEDHPLYNLSGVGAAYKLSEALLNDHLDAESAKTELNSLLDLVTLGLIADMVPLTKENRYLVQVGLKELAGSKRPGVKALLGNIGKQSGTDIVGFGLAPRINAAGRLSDASVAVELLTTESDDVAAELADRLERENQKRQAICEEVFAEADRLIASGKVAQSQRAIAIYKHGWHHGVVGIVASRLVEKYGKAVFIGELDAETQKVKGSARGIEGLDLYEALNKNASLLEKFGGHKMAAGFTASVDCAEAFCKSVVLACEQLMQQSSQYRETEIDLVLNPEEVDNNLAQEITKLGPFGMDNSKPNIVMLGLTCKSVRSIGKEGKHSKLALVDPLSGQEFEAVMWSSRGLLPEEGWNIDLAFFPELNHFNGTTRLQLVVSDWRSLQYKAKTQVESSRTQSEPASSSESVGLSKSENLSKSDSPPNPIKPVVAETAKVSMQDEVSKVPGVSAETVSEVSQASSHRPAQTSTSAATTTVFKDLRKSKSPEDILLTAKRKLQDKIVIFAEGGIKHEQVKFHGRADIGRCEHLLFWQFPPGMQLFQNLVEISGAKQIYLVGAHDSGVQDAEQFLKRLMGLIRYAVNKKDGVAKGESIASALAATKMSVALGLTIFKKSGLIDWFSEEGMVHFELLEFPQEDPQNLPEYRHLSKVLAETQEFRKWCHKATLNELQLHLLPASLDLSPTKEASEAND